MTEENKGFDEGKSEYEDWDKKYDVTLNVSMNEYNHAVEGIQKTDEKANKYLVLLCAIIAAVFAALPTNLTDNLKLSLEFEKTITVLSWLIVLLFIFLIITCIIVMRSLIKCFKLQKCNKLPCLSEFLKYLSGANVTEFKHALIAEYDKCIESYENAKSLKQEHLRVASNFILISFVILCAYILSLFLIKLISI